MRLSTDNFPGIIKVQSSNINILSLLIIVSDIRHANNSILIVKHCYSPSLRRK